MAHKSLRLLAGLILAAFTATSIQAQTTAGSWSARPSDKPDMTEVSFVYGHSSQSSDWRLADLKGLRLSPAERHDVRFAIARDAGRIEAEGASAAGTAAGSFRFQPEPGYAGELRKLGLGDIKPDTQIAFALHDVSLAFARDMIGLGIGAGSADKLLAFRIHGVDPAYVKDLRAAGVSADADQLIAFRIHGVTPDYAAALGKLGYDHPRPDQLIALKIHGVTPDYIASVKAKGVRDISLEQLVAMKIHGID